MSRYKDLDEDLGRPESAPLLAALTGGAVIVVVGALAPQFFGYIPLTMLLAGAGGMAVVFWLIGYVATIRHASGGWKIGSLVILLGLAATAALAAYLLGQMAARSDASTLSAMELGPDGTPIFARGAESRGPLSKTFIETTRANFEDQRNFNRETVQTGVGQLNSPYTLSQNPAVLKNCGVVDTLKAKAAELKQRRQARLDAMIRMIDALDQPGEFKRGLKMTLAPGDTPEQLNTMLAQQEKLLDATKALCVLLAKRSWVNQFAYFGFASSADANEYKFQTERRTAAVTALSRLEREGRARMREGQTIVDNGLQSFILF